VADTWVWILLLLTRWLTWGRVDVRCVDFVGGEKKVLMGGIGVPGWCCML
jgi:hypothetical protein